MKTEHFFRAFVTLSLLSIATSCIDTDNPNAFTTAQFVEPALAISENVAAQTINITFNQPAKTDGEITLNTIATATCFFSEPVTQNGQVKIHVSKGDNGVAFKMTPIDNNDLDGNKTVRFKISTLTEGIREGLRNEIVVSVSDDESPAAVTFLEPNLQFRENSATPGRITLAFASAAPADGVLVLKLQSTSIYDFDYTTSPAAVGGKIFLQIAKGATSATVDVIAVNDNTFKADRNISFRIFSATGGLTVGTEDPLWCTITEDDGYQLSPIADIRASYKDDATSIKTDLYVEGIVTSLSNINGGRVVIEDATGALPISFNVPNTLKRGDVVVVNLRQGKLRKVSGVLEASEVVTFEKLGEDILHISKVTLEDLFLSGDDLQSQTVQIGGAQFSQANGTTTLGGDRILTDGTLNIFVRTNSFVDFANQVIPQGPVNVTGILTKVDGQYFIYPQAFDDIRIQGNSTIIKPNHPRGRH